MPNKLLIYETTHFENISALLVLSEHFFEEATIFICDDSKRQLEHILNNFNTSLKINWVTQGRQSNRAFIRETFRFIKRNQYTHLHIGTLDHNLIFFAFHLLLCPKLKVSMTLHAINTYRTYAYASFKDVSESVAKPILHRRVEAYRVLSPGMTEYYKKMIKKSNVFFIPGNFTKPKGPDPVQRKDDIFRIIIPGTVEKVRRDYDFVGKFFSQHLASLTQVSKIELTLAGNASSLYGQAIVSQLIKLTENNRFSIKYFQEILDQSVYETLYENADIVLAPLVINRNYSKNRKEITSLSHSPGLFTDQLYLGKPAITPSGLVQTKVQSYNRIYDNSEELFNILYQLMTGRSKLKQTEDNMRQTCDQLNRDFFLNDFISLFTLDK
jgi:hypothetical protein